MHTCCYCRHTGPDVHASDSGRVPVIYMCDDDVACSQRKPGEPKTVTGLALYETARRKYELETEMELILDVLEQVPDQIRGVTPSPAATVAWLVGYYLEATNDTIPEGS